MSRWNWPFKTEEERQLVIKYNRRIDREESKQKEKDFFDTLEEAPF